MEMTPCQNMEAGIRDFLFLAQHKPYEYSGTWYGAWHNNYAVWYRRKKCLINYLHKQGLKNVELVQIN